MLLKIEVEAGKSSHNYDKILEDAGKDPTISEASRYNDQSVNDKIAELKKFVLQKKDEDLRSEEIKKQTNNH